VTGKQIPLEWVLPESERTPALRELEAAGATVVDSDNEYRRVPGDPLLPEGSSFEPLVVIACAVPTVYLIRQVAELWRDIRDRGGEIIDARSGTVRRRRVPSLDRGTLILLTDDGSTVYRPHEEAAAMEALRGVLGKLER
jgi:hypothetical protein